jgi:phosphonoacetate hydrolase
MATSDTVELHGRRYRKPARPVVVICVDGFDPAYLDRGLGDGMLPAIAGLARAGWCGTAAAVMPTFTNPNNVSIVTGASPARHGIAGNYYLDRETQEEVMITDDRLMRVLRSSG